MPCYIHWAVIKEMSAATSRGLEGRPSLTETRTIRLVRTVIESVEIPVLSVVGLQNVLKQQIFIRWRLDIIVTLQLPMGSETKTEQQNCAKTDTHRNLRGGTTGTKCATHSVKSAHCNGITTTIPPIINTSGPRFLRV